MTWDELPGKEAFVTIVNGVVRVVCAENQIVKRSQRRTIRENLFDGQRIDVMNYPSIWNLITRDAEVAAAISEDDVLSSSTPTWRSIETLVQVTSRTECRIADLTLEGEILEPL